jgi:hypothetical protein
MAIAASDIQFRLSVKTGAAGDSTAGSVAGSLGKYMSTTEITDNTLNNLFDDVSGDENAASDVEYRCIFILNNHATLTWTSVVAWLSAEVAGGASIAIAVDDIVDSDHDDADAQAYEAANEGTDPSAATGDWSTATSKATGVALGDIAPLSCRAIWVRRTAANTVAVDNDGVTISVAGDTAA